MAGFAAVAVKGAVIATVVKARGFVTNYNLVVAEASRDTIAAVLNRIKGVNPAPARA